MDLQGKKLKSVNAEKELLPERVSKQIADLIAERKIKAGEKLPNEFDMAQQLNVGRGTIREAVKILVSRNVVEIRRGCGTFVCENPGIIEDPLGFAFADNKAKLPIDLVEFRSIIEPEMAALAAIRATDKDIREIELAADNVERLCLMGENHKEQDILFHELIAKSTKNQVMLNIIPAIQSGIGHFIDATASSLIEETIRTHRKIVEGIKEHNPDKARKAMREHLQNNIDKINDLNR